MLVGREREIQLLHEALDRLSSGEGSQWLIRGEAGIGKSALLSEARGEAARRGIAVTDVSLIEGITVESLWPWAVLAHELLFGGSEEQYRSLTAALGGPALTALASLVPGLRADGADAVSAGAHDVGRLALIGALKRLLQHATAREPLVVLIDNFQRFDRSSLELFRQVLPALQRFSVCLILTLREPSPRLTGRHHGFIADLLYGASAQAITLDGLEAPEVQKLAGDLELTLTVREAAALVEESRGNPLFLTEMLRAISDATPDTGGDAATSFLSAPDVAKRFYPLVHHRLAALSSYARHLLNCAAVLGRRVTLQEVEAASEESFDLSAAVAEIERAGILEPEAAGGYRFVHDIVRRAIIAALPAAEQSRLSEQAARGLERLHGSSTPEQAARLSDLYLSGRSAASRARGIHFGLISANRALESYAWESALAVAEDLLARFNDSLHDDARARLRLVRGSALFRLARRYEAFADFLAAFDYLYERRDLEAITTLLLNHSYVEAGDIEIYRITERAVKIIPESSPHELYLRFQHTFSLTAAIGDYHAALAEADRIQALADQQPDDIQRSIVRTIRVHILVKLRRYEEAREQLGRVPGLDPRRAPSPEGYHLMVLGELALRDGNITAAQRYYEETVRTVRPIGDASLTATMLYFVAKMELHRANFERVRELATESAELHPTQANVYLHDIIACYYGGEIASGDRRLRQLLELASEIPLFRGVIPANSACCIAFRYMTTGERRWVDTAIEYASALLGGSSSHPVVVARAAFALAEIVSMEARRGAPVDFELVRRAEEGLDVTDRYSVLADEYALYGRALLRELRGDRTGMRDYLSRAAEEARRVSNLPALAWILADIAVYDRSADAGHEAKTLASRYRMNPLLHKLGTGGALTVRELEVLRRVARGMTNQEVATELEISVHTVARHLSSILQKTETASRTEAVHDAVRRGIIRLE